MQFRMRAPGRHEDFNQYLGIKISLHAHAQSANQQVLMMELTDEQDPLFLFQLSCSEQDFHIFSLTSKLSRNPLWSFSTSAQAKTKLMMRPAQFQALATGSLLVSTLRLVAQMLA